MQRTSGNTYTHGEEKARLLKETERELLETEENYVPCG